MMRIHWAYAALALFLLAAAPLLAEEVAPGTPPKEVASRQGGHAMRPSDALPVVASECDAAEPSCGEADAKP